MNDCQVMIEVRDGNLSKLSVLYERYKTKLFAYFYRVTSGDQSMSEDLVHQVFIRVIKYKSNFKGYGSFASWLFHIAHHIAIDFNRGKKYHLEYEEAKDKLVDEPDPQQSIEEKEDIHRLNEALAKLRFEDREIITLGKIRELRYKEVADIMGLTEGNVRVKIHRALQELKKVYFELEKI